MSASTANEPEPKPNAEAWKHGSDASSAVDSLPTPMKSTPAGFDFEKKFDLYLTLLGEKGAEKSSRLVSFNELEKKAQELGTKVPFLSLSVLEKHIKDGLFCLKSNLEATFDPTNMTLEEYAEREKEGSKRLESGRQSLTVFWKKKEEVSISGPAEIATKTNLSKLDDESQFASQLKEKTKLPSTFKKELQSKESELDAQDKMDMNSAKWSSPDLLKDEEWDAVLDGNQLFYAYHVPVSVNEKLKQLEDQIPKPSSNEDSKPADNNKKTTKPSSNEDSKAADNNKNPTKPSSNENSSPAENNNNPTKPSSNEDSKPADKNKNPTKPSSNEDSKPADKNKNNPIPGAENNNTGTKAADGVSGKDILDASMNGTMDEELETPEIFVQALRPAYVVNPHSKLGSTKSVNSKPGQVNAGLFWSSSKSVASTRISKTMSTLDTWLLQSSYSKKSFNIGLSGGFKGVDLGGKFGFDSERTQKSSASIGKKDERLTAVHEIPIIDINLNETTLQLSPDCVKDIVRLRQDRRFADLKKFYEDYGTTFFQTITLGGRLYSDHILTKDEKNMEEKTSKDFKTQTEASLGIPSQVEGSIAYSTAKGEAKVNGERKVSITNNVLWRGFGGDPTLSVDPAKWRESVLQYQNWRKIKQDNAIKIEELISRFPGYEDIPGLIDGILNSAVLDPLALVIPSEIMGRLRIGQSIDSATGELTPDIPSEPSVQAQPGKSVAGGFSWRVLRSERDLKSEISASLQATLNISVNLPAIPSYLYDMQVGEKAMTVIFKWSSTAQELCLPEKEVSTSVKSKESSVQDGGKEGDTKSPDSGQEQSAQSEKKGAEGLSRELLLSSITKKAWMVGIWHINATKTTKKLAFENLSLAVYKYFSETRQIQEGCDFLSQVVRERSLVTQDFKLLASNGTGACEHPVTQSEWGSAARASDMILRQLRLRYINTLPFRATLRPIGTTAAETSSLWAPVESCLLYYQEAVNSAIFLNSRFTALGIKDALTSPKKDKKWQENSKSARLMDQAKRLKVQWEALKTGRGCILQGHIDSVQEILTALDGLEVDLATLTEEETGDQQIDSDTGRGSKMDGNNSRS